MSPLVKEIFRESRQNYGTRKIKVELQKLGYVISRRRIGRIMKNQGLVGSVAKFLKPSYNLEKRGEEYYTCDILKENSSRKTLFW
ncbi:transposase [Bacillus albus]|nr:transposase [Bacillus albus]RXJ23511.1 transposase [Bacillus albus]RXJ24862.1 transposase [Bacillus albus]RXJ36152.1 transposase [Bacillus albus]RXJ54387.1 transposase [Bacillus albus]